MISSTKSLALSLGITLALGAFSVPLGCGGSGRGLPALAHEDAKLPEGIALHVRTCAAEHREHLRSADLSVRFELKLAIDGQVDSVALLDSTLGDEDLEACMADALWKLSEDALPTRRSSNRLHDHAAPESHMFFGQTQLMACLASPPCVLALAFLVGATYITVQVLVHTASQSSTAKPKPRATATATATATSIPTAVPVDDERERCKRVKDRCIEHCADAVLDQGENEPQFSRCLRGCMARSGC